MQQNNFDQELRSIKSEQQFQQFIQRNQNDPRVQRMLQMTQGRNPNDIMGIAQNLANNSQVNLQDVRNSFGF